jgi:transposase
MARRTPAAWRQGLEVVAMDGFTGYKTAAAEEVPDAVAVMDPFHVVRVRHEVLCVRAGVRDPCRSAVAAAGLKLRAA